MIYWKLYISHFLLLRIDDYSLDMIYVKLYISHSLLLRIDDYSLLQNH